MTQYLFFFFLLICLLFPASLYSQEADPCVGQLEANVEQATQQLQQKKLQIVANLSADVTHAWLDFFSSDPNETIDVFPQIEAGSDHELEAEIVNQLNSPVELIQEAFDLQQEDYKAAETYDEQCSVYELEYNDCETNENTV